jgi:preprotein translocase subunit SecB
MAEELNQDALSPQQTEQGPQVQIQKLYTKDISFEIPNAPQVFQENGQAEVKMNLAQRVEDLEENVKEVVLTVTAMVGEKTAYLAEVAQAGIFHVSGFNEQQTHAIMNTVCPNTLFPYARSTIANLVGDGGFPPLVLQPLNFEQLYAQRMQQMASDQAQGAEADAGGEETVTAEFPGDN